MSFLSTIPALIRILIVFAVILLCIHRKLALGHCFSLGAFILGILFGMYPVAILKSAAMALSHPKTLSLAAVVSLILVLSHSLEAAGQMQRLLERFQGLIRIPAINIVIFPALIGLLPMPGGAIFSAPMVKNMGCRGQLNAADLSYVNYWFRHIWEYWWPLYPGVLLITALGSFNLWSLVLKALPMTVVAVAAGYWPLRGKLSFRRQGHRSAPSAASPSPLPFIKELTPILIVIVLGIVIGAGLSRLRLCGHIAKETGLIIALLLAILLVWQTNGISMATRRKILFNRKLGSMVYMVASILIFKGILEDSQAVDAVSSELLVWGIPLTVVAVALPMLVGLVSGITIAFVGTTFPILISLIHASPANHALLLPYLILGLVSGFVGVLFSPLHVCLLLSNEYFETSLDQVYRHLLVPCLAMLIAALSYFQILCRL
jgi:integral membrane protein (TIGR00529 family)